MSKPNKISNEIIIKIAMTILDLLIANGEWFDTCIYFLDHTFCTEGYFKYQKPVHCFSRRSGKYVEKVYVFSNVKAENDLKFHGGILSIAIASFSNCLYNDTEIRFQINRLLAQHGLFWRLARLGIFPYIQLTDFTEMSGSSVASNKTV